MKIAKFDNGKVSENGNLIKFEAHGTDGEIEFIEMPTKNIGNMIAFLAGLAQFAERKKTPGQLASDHAKGLHEGPLIEFLTMGVSPGRTPHEMVLAFQIGEFSLGFAVSTSQLRPVLEVLAQNAPKQHPPKH